MLKKLKRKKAEKLRSQIVITDARLALTKAELAARMIKLAGQTSDITPLQDASASLKAARDFFGLGHAPVEICLVQIALGDTLLKLGRAQSNKTIMQQAKTAYRTAITMASLQGEESLRKELRAKVKLVDRLLGDGPKTPSLFRAA